MYLKPFSIHVIRTRLLAHYVEKLVRFQTPNAAMYPVKACSLQVCAQVQSVIN